MSGGTFVYVLKCIDVTESIPARPCLTFVKVGISRDPVKRAKQLQDAMPHLIGLRWISDPMSHRSALHVEAAAHRILESANVKGEWFLTHPDLAVWAVQKAAALKVSRGYAEALDHLAETFAELDRFSTLLDEGADDPEASIRAALARDPDLRWMQ